jgi:hypothetical protein
MPATAFPRDWTSERHARAWTLLVGAFALHAADEALTDFLDFYNPLVLSIRPAWSPFPPTFDVGTFLGVLIVASAVLALMTPAVRRGWPGTRLASWVFAIIMFLNGVGHLAGSLYWNRWLPGATSAPLLLLASVYLGRATAMRAESPPAVT